MSKQIYISADYDERDGDREVVEILNNWGQDNYHIVNFIDMSKVASGSVSDEPDCRICDLKREFNQQINASSAVIFVVGNKTSDRTAGCACNRVRQNQLACFCTPYKQNTNGLKLCKVSTTYDVGPNDDVGCINSFSYLRHEFEQAKKRRKPIIILYNSMKKEPAWLPTYMSGYEAFAAPFWTINAYGYRVGNYSYIKEVLGFD